MRASVKWAVPPDRTEIAGQRRAALFRMVRVYRVRVNRKSILISDSTGSPCKIAGAKRDIWAAFRAAVEKNGGGVAFAGASAAEMGLPALFSFTMTETERSEKSGGAALRSIFGTY